MNDIHTAAAIIIKDHKILNTRTAVHKAFISPGGSIEHGETPEQAVIRELKEELNIDVPSDGLTFYGTFTDEAATQPGRMVIMKLFMIHRWEGEITPTSEVTELFWADSTDMNNPDLGSIFAKQVMPKLFEDGLIG